MRMSDWSADGCSADLRALLLAAERLRLARGLRRIEPGPWLALAAGRRGSGLCRTFRRAVGGCLLTGRFPARAPALEQRLTIDGSMAAVAEGKKQRLQIGRIAAGEGAKRCAGGEAGSRRCAFHARLVCRRRLRGGQLVGLPSKALEPVGAHRTSAAVPAGYLAV